MRTRTLSPTAVWPALLGVLAAHEVAYSGHDDGHLHGYLDTVGPALVVAAVLGWIWSWARARVEFRSVLTFQLLLFGLMEMVERLAATTGFRAADLAPIAIAFVVIPLASALTVLADRAIELVACGRCRPIALDPGPGTDRAALDGAHLPRPSVWSIRAPPSVA